MEIFVVYKVGVYIQNCAGIYSTEEKAREEAKRLLLGEGDAHHDFEVVRYILDEMPVPREAQWRMDSIYEEPGQSLARYEKRSGVVREMDD